MNVHLNIEATRDMRKMLRIVDNLEAHKAYERCMSRLHAALLSIGWPEDKLPNPTGRIQIGTRSIQGFEAFLNYSCPLSYEQLLDAATDRSAIDSTGDLYVEFRFEEDVDEMNVIVSVTLYKNVPEDDLNTLRALGKSHVEYREASVHESFYC